MYIWNVNKAYCLYKYIKFRKSRKTYMFFLHCSFFIPHVHCFTSGWQFLLRVGSTFHPPGSKGSKASTNECSRRTRRKKVSTGWIFFAQWSFHFYQLQSSPCIRCSSFEHGYLQASHESTKVKICDHETWESLLVWDVAIIEWCLLNENCIFSGMDIA